MTKTLIINSIHDCSVPAALPWFSCAPRSIYEHLDAESKDVEIIEEDAYPEALRDYILEHPELERIYGLGHGWDSGFTVNECLPFISTEQNLDLVENRVIHLLSCLTGRNLGPAIVSANAYAYYGYNELFMIVAESNSYPCSCRFHTACLAGDMEIEYSLHNKRDYEQCWNDAIQHWNEEIAYWENHYDEETIPISGSADMRVSEAMASTLIDVIIHDRDALTLITGEISPPSIQSKAPELLLLLSIIALGGVVITTHSDS
jgi:hypothetical protein